MNSKFEEHSKKDCVCGGHSAKDVKKNKNHNSTRTKLNRRKMRKFLFHLGNKAAVFSLLSLTLFSCKKYEGDFEKFSIAKHYSCHRVNPISSNVVTGSTILNTTCTYELEDSTYDQINKLVGLGSGMNGVHKNSARIGWRYLNDSFELFAYWYVEGERSWSQLTTVAVGEEFTYLVSISEEGFLMDVNGISESVENPNDKLPKSYMLYPYFGGKYPNPNKEKMEILLKY